MKDLNRRDSVLTMLGMAILTAAFVFTIYLPEQRAAQAIKSQITDVQKSIREVSTRLAELEQLKRDIIRRRDFLRKTDQIIPSDSDLPAILGTIARLAENSEISMTRLEPLEPVQYESYRVLAFQINFVGEFRGIAAFLKGMESCQRLFTVEKLSLKSAILESRNNRKSIEGDLDFSVYIRQVKMIDTEENNAS